MASKVVTTKPVNISQLCRELSATLGALAPLMMNGNGEDPTPKTITSTVVTQAQLDAAVAAHVWAPDPPEPPPVPPPPGTVMTVQADGTVAPAPIPTEPGPKGDPGLVLRGAWDPAVSYVSGDAVTHLGSTYYALQGSTNNNPTTSPTKWSLLAAKGDPGLPGLKGPAMVSIGSYNVLTNVGAAYDAVPNAKGLGVAVVDFTGYTSIDFRVFVSKVGTGIQSWQLWNVTDGTQLAVIDDPAASAAGDKLLTTTAAILVPILGKKLVRVRAKSSIAADDPVFYGAAALLS